MKRSYLFVVSVALVVTSVLMAACGTADSTTASTVTDPSAQKSIASTTSSSTLPAQTLRAPDGWSITLIPGTDKMIAQLERDNNADQSNGTVSMPAPAMFDPSVAVDGERVIYSALYDKMPQVYLYDIASGEVTQLTDDPPANHLEQVEVQISGDWVAWMRGYNTEDIHLCNLISGETKEFTPQHTVVSWRLVDNRLAWEEAAQLHDSQLYLYDPAVGSVQTIDAARGLLSFDMDNEHIAWAGGPDLNELYLYDLSSGETTKVTEDSQQNGESIVVKGNILAWTDRTGDRTTLVVYRLSTGEKSVVDKFGPFNPELQSDGRYVAWNRGEQETGTEVWVYDTKTGKTVDLGGTWPSIEKGRIAWLGSSPRLAGQEVVMVRDLASGPTTQLTDSQWSDQPPVVNGGHVVWSRRNPDPASSQGRGVFVATAPG